jgi:hypothetical protein
LSGGVTKQKHQELARKTEVLIKATYMVVDAGVVGVVGAVSNP